MSDQETFHCDHCGEEHEVTATDRLVHGAAERKWKTVSDLLGESPDRWNGAALVVEAMEEAVGYGNELFERYMAAGLSEEEAMAHSTSISMRIMAGFGVMLMNHPVGAQAYERIVDEEIAYLKERM